MAAPRWSVVVDLSMFNDRYGDKPQRLLAHNVRRWTARSVGKWWIARHPGGSASIMLARNVPENLPLVPAGDLDQSDAGASWWI
jgi:hypothetical protein